MDKKTYILVHRRVYIYIVCIAIEKLSSFEPSKYHRFTHPRFPIQECFFQHQIRPMDKSKSGYFLFHTNTSSDSKPIYPAYRLWSKITLLGCENWIVMKGKHRVVGRGLIKSPENNTFLCGRFFCGVECSLFRPYCLWHHSL